MTRLKYQASLALLATMIVWGTSAVYMRKTALDLSPENAIAIRYLLLALILIPALVISGGWRIARQDWPRLLVTGLPGMLGYTWFVNEGFARVAAGLGTIITMVEPLFIALLALAVLGEKLSANILYGIGVSILGALVLFWPDIVQDTAQHVDKLGVIYLVIACFCWAIYTIAAKPLMSSYSGFAIAGWSMLMSAPFLIALASQPIASLASSLTAKQWGETLFLVSFGSLLGTTMWNYGAKHLSGAVAGSFLYLIPVVAVTAGWILLGEAITPHLVIGGALVLAGVALAQFGGGEKAGG